MFLSDSDDITLPDTLLTFFSSINEQCFPVQIVPDIFVEAEELVTLQLSTTSEGIVLFPETTVIIISDNDCKYTTN